MKIIEIQLGKNGKAKVFAISTEEHNPGDYFNVSGEIFETSMVAYSPETDLFSYELNGFKRCGKISLKDYMSPEIIKLDSDEAKKINSKRGFI